MNNVLSTTNDAANGRNYCLCCGARAEHYGSGSVSDAGIAKYCSKEVCVFCLEGGGSCFGSRLAQSAGEWHEGCGCYKEEKT